MTEKKKTGNWKKKAGNQKKRKKDWKLVNM